MTVQALALQRSGMVKPDWVIPVLLMRAAVNLFHLSVLECLSALQGIAPVLILERVLYLAVSQCQQLSAAPAACPLHASIELLHPIPDELWSGCLSALQFWPPANALPDCQQ